MNLLEISNIRHEYLEKTSNSHTIIIVINNSQHTVYPLYFMYIVLAHSQQISLLNGLTNHNMLAPGLAIFTSLYGACILVARVSPIHVPPVQRVLKHCGAHIHTYTYIYTRI